MPVVVPKRVEIVAAFFSRPDHLRFLRLVLRDEQNRALASGFPGSATDRADDVFFGGIVNALGRIEAEPVEMEFLDPVTAVRDEELADGSGIVSVEVDRVAPFVRAFAVDVIVRKNAEIVAVRAEVVVDDIENYGEAEGMRSVDEEPQIVRGTV